MAIGTFEQTGSSNCMPWHWHTAFRWLRVLLGCAAGWALLALVFASQGYLASAYRGNPQDWWPTLGYSLAFYSVWALLTPFVLILARKVSFGTAPARRFLAVHLAASITTALLQSLIFALLFWPLYNNDGQLPTRFALWQSMLVVSFHSNLLIYWLLVGATAGFSYYTKFRDRELRASRLEAQLAQAEMAALRAQLQPHFLFNTLHAISALVRDDPPAAERMIARLGDLLRMSLETRDTQLITMQTELSFVRAYLDIEKVRFGERLQVEEQIDPAVLGASVPALILQPLVENALKHGIAPLVRGGCITLAARSQGDMLALEVRDNGAGTALPAMTEGIGLSNTRARLEGLYGNRQRFALGSRTGSGFAVSIELPLSMAPAGKMENRQA